MFVGHLAIALGGKRAAPVAPLAWLVAASFFLDLIWPFLLLAGVERVSIDPGNTAFTPASFDNYPWSHSLAMTLVWSLAAGAAAAAVLGSQRAGVVIGMVVASHWLLDFVTHRPDLPLWPGGPEVGLGLWHSIPATVIVEGALLAIAVATYRRRFPARNSMGVWSFWGLIAFTTLIWLSGPWAPPPPNATSIAVVALAMWLFPFWAQWIEKHRARGDERRSAASPTQ
jgi:hypothetical protein